MERARRMVEEGGEEQAERGEEEKSEESLLDIVVRQLAGHGPPAHQIWLPPLDVPPTLDELLPELSVTPERGFTAAGWEWRGRLHAVAGIGDRPFSQPPHPLCVGLAGAAVHVGARRSPPRRQP